jgi:hypothetical protein
MGRTPSNNLTVLFANEPEKMLPMVKTKGNGAERLYKAFHYGC